ncbi:hypothetical protein D3C76_1854750 [compost metagenome]
MNIRQASPQAICAGYTTFGRLSNPRKPSMPSTSRSASWVSSARKNAWAMITTAKVSRT